MKVKITINKPRSRIEGYTGFVTLPSGKIINVYDYCGGAPVAFNTREQFIKAAKLAAQNKHGNRTNLIMRDYKREQHELECAMAALAALLEKDKNNKSAKELYQEYYQQWLKCAILYSTAET